MNHYKSAHYKTVTEGAHDPITPLSVTRYYHVLRVIFHVLTCLIRPEADVRELSAHLIHLGLTSYKSSATEAHFVSPSWLNSSLHLSLSKVSTTQVLHQPCWAWISNITDSASLWDQPQHFLSHCHPDDTASHDAHSWNYYMMHPKRPHFNHIFLTALHCL